MYIGIFGGSFNPIHVGHIALARHIRKECGLDEVWLLVSPQNPLKEQSTLAPEHLRLQWAQQALEDEEGLKASDFEFRLPRPSYTWDTLQALSQTFPQHHFHLIIGGDNWNNFHRWHRWQDILRHYPLIIYPRNNSRPPIDNPSITLDDSSRSIENSSRIIEKTKFLSSAPLLNISSTEIREKIARNEPVEGLVPATIIPSLQGVFH